MLYNLRGWVGASLYPTPLLSIHGYRLPSLYFGRFMLLKVLFYTQSQKRCPLYTLRYVSVYLMVILLAIPLLLMIVVMCFFVGNSHYGEIWCKNETQPSWN